MDISLGEPPFSPLHWASHFPRPEGLEGRRLACPEETGQGTGVCQTRGWAMRAEAPRMRLLGTRGVWTDQGWAEGHEALQPGVAGTDRRREEGGAWLG